DLSETSIKSLPTKGLENIEDLSLRNVHTLLVFPSVYNFRYIKRAELTYPYHCCAFKFPETQNPAEHNRFTRSCSHDRRPPDQMGFIKFLQAHIWLARQFSSWFAPKRSARVGSGNALVTVSSNGQHNSDHTYRSYAASESPHKSTRVAASVPPGLPLGTQGTAHSESAYNIRHTHRHTRRREKRNRHLGDSPGPTMGEISAVDPHLQHYSGQAYSTETPTYGRIIGMVPITKLDPNDGNWRASFDLHDVTATQ
ncbi:follicle-stimulating hormone receptor-like, partial [Tropilaelaps mercedesae]